MTAKQIDALWSGLNDPNNGKSYDGALVQTFAVGTSTPKAVWEDRDKTLPTAAGKSQFALDSNGQAEVFGDGVYKISVYDPKDTGYTTPIYTIDGAEYKIGTIAVVFLSEYTDLAAAVTAIGATDTELWLDADDSSNAIVPSTMSIRPLSGYIQSGTVTWNGPIIGDPIFQWLSGAGHTLGIGSTLIINPMWWGLTSEELTASEPTSGTIAANDVAIAQALLTGSANKAKVIFPAGAIWYGDNSAFKITDTIMMVGAGKRNTVFRPSSDFTGGWFLTIDDCWRNAGTGEGDDTVDFSETRSGVILRDFSVVGDRSTDPAATHGIRTYNRVDELLIEDVDILYMIGTGLSLGANGDGIISDGLCRESTFNNIFVRGCGSVAGGFPAVDIDSPGTSGDATNQLDFNSCRFVYNYNSVLVRGTSASRKTRRIQFNSLMLHGLHTAADAPAADVMVIRGNIDAVVFKNLRTNGSSDVSGTLYSCITLDDNATGEAPSGIRVDMDLRTCEGNGIRIIHASYGCTFDGFSDSSSIAGDELIVESNAVTSLNQKIRYSVEANATGRSIDIDSTVSSMVNYGWSGSNSKPFRFDTGQLVLGDGGAIGGANTPGVFFGTDATPEGAVTAPRRSLFYRISTDNVNSVDGLWVKTSSTTNTGWQRVIYFLNSTQTALESNSALINTESKWAGMQVWDDTNDIPVWASGSGATDVWIDGVGATVYTPV